MKRTKNRTKPSRKLKICLNFVEICYWTYFATLFTSRRKEMHECSHESIARVSQIVIHGSVPTSMPPRASSLETGASREKLAVCELCSQSIWKCFQRFQRFEKTAELYRPETHSENRWTFPTGSPSREMNDCWSELLREKIQVRKSIFSFQLASEKVIANCWWPISHWPLVTIN